MPAIICCRRKRRCARPRTNLAYFETQRAQLEANNLQRKAEAGEVGVKLEGLTVVIVRQAGESGQLYGSVSARDIADAVTDGRVHDRKAPGRSSNARSKPSGLHPLRIVLHPEVSVGVTANVAQSVEEAAMQARGIDPLRMADEDEDEREAAASPPTPGATATAENA